mgnify:CR=1 FL=1
MLCLIRVNPLSVRSAGSVPVGQSVHHPPTGDGFRVPGKRLLQNPLAENIFLEMFIWQMGTVKKKVKMISLS